MEGVIDGGGAPDEPATELSASVLLTVPVFNDVTPNNQDVRVPAFVGFMAVLCHTVVKNDADSRVLRASR